MSQGSMNELLQRPASSVLVRSPGNGQLESGERSWSRKACPSPYTCLSLAVWHTFCNLSACQLLLSSISGAKKFSLDRKGEHQQNMHERPRHQGNLQSDCSSTWHIKSSNRTIVQHSPFCTTPVAPSSPLRDSTRYPMLPRSKSLAHRRCRSSLQIAMAFSDLSTQKHFNAEMQSPPIATKWLLQCHQSPPRYSPIHTFPFLVP